MVSPRWLAEGFAIWKHFEIDRDYLLPCPTSDLQGVRDCYASYNDAAALSQALHNELRWRKLCPERGWQGLPMRLCSARVQEDFGRSIPNATVLRAWELLWDLARLSESIWDVGRPTALRGTSGLPRLLSTRFRASARVHCARLLARRISLRSLSSWRISTGSQRPRGTRSEAREHQKERLQFFKDREGLLPGSSEGAGDGQAAEVSKVDAETVLEELPPLPGHYFITLTRRGRTRRLHCFGSCPTAGLHQLLDVCVRASHAREAAGSPGIGKVCGRFGPLLALAFSVSVLSSLSRAHLGFGRRGFCPPTHRDLFFRGAGLTCGLRFEDKESFSICFKMRYFLLGDMVNSRRCWQCAQTFA